MEQNSIHSDKELFGRIARDDAYAYTTIFDLYFDRLRYSALKFLKSEFWAEEVAQEVFLHLWDDRSKLLEVDNPAAWLYRIVSNKCINLLRRNELELRAQYIIHQSALQTQPGQGSAFDYALVSKLVKEAIDQLPPQQRRVYLLKTEEGYSYKQIAEELGVSPNTVHNHLARSVQSVRKYLIEHGDFSVLVFFLLFY